MEMNYQMAYTELYAELEGYEKDGVSLMMEGTHVSPMQVVRELMAREDGSYMRDYEMDPNGYIESLSFTDVNRKNGEIKYNNEHKPS